MDGPLPYLTDSGTTVAVYLVARPAGGTMEQGLELAKTLGGGGLQVYRAASSSAAAWDHGSGQLHTISAGYVGDDYVGVLVGTAAFCSRTTAFTTAEGEALAGMLQAVVESYR
ncbi:MAG: hypothetical protein ACYC5O_10770 [Anaerolineae bacterium]